ncbi:DUF3413 domain-containing protein [Idiomarina seosinensis]|uniref:Alkaline phosphatase n=1 Tax=Idiomarina seosinensis TaxID=281739 RepID=A0A432ZHK6_9GAMM|nr:DUF3413 domain-containing protein [Idiomarina seosinensis]RUO77466.1 alkaline phosphatase [Idiomarina seosinensis]
MGKHQRRDKIARLISWGHWFTFINIILCLALGSLYIEATPSAESALGTLYTIVSWIGHFAFLPFVFFIVLIFPLCLVLPYSRILRGWSALIGSLGIIALAADLLFFRQYGYHLNAYSLAQMAKDAETVFTGASFLIILAVLLGFLVLLGFELLIANYTWKHLQELQKRRLGAPAVSIFVLCFFASHLTHVWADAELYEPITQQDDMFPLSYPTTAKTLMAKHGVIDVESYQAQQQMLMAADNIKLRYPQNEMLCTKLNDDTSITLIVFDRLNAENQEKLAYVADQVPLSPVNTQMLGHPSREGGLFQLLYGLPDFYLDTIETQQVTPAYIKPLDDFGVQSHWIETENWSNNLQLDQFNQQWQLTALDDFIPRPRNQFNVIFISQDDVESMYKLFALTANHKVIVTSLAPADSESLLGQQQFMPKNMSVPLYERGFNLPKQPIAGLMDVVPTALGDMMSCAGGTKSFSNGENLSKGGERWPLVETYSPYIVIYDAAEITILDNTGQFSVYDNQTFDLKKGAEPPVPVLIDALKDLKRFSRDSSNTND